MPIYEYQCAACGRITEKWQNFSEAPLTVCPDCGGNLNKIISACTFQLKGSGWYVTDYGGSRHGAVGGDNSPGAQESSGSETGSGVAGESAAPAAASAEASAPSKIK